MQAGADRQQTLYKDWTVKVHADGQWADGPLFGNEQYAMGGVTGVRGYTDGEAYGDEGWRVMIEPQLPPLDIGMFGNEGSEEPCWLRGSVFMDYGETYLLDPPSGGSGPPEILGRWLGRHRQHRDSSGRTDRDGLSADGHAANTGRRHTHLLRLRRTILNENEFQIVTGL